MILDCFDRDEDVSLYVHVPFCASKCAYCAFYSIPQNMQTDALVKSYFKRLITEINKAVSYFKKPFKTIYIGGGTPLLTGNVKYIKEVLEASRSTLSDEVTIECNAPNITDEVKRDIIPLITRLSVGIQSFDKGVLKFFQRREAKDEDILNILRLDKKINFDFIAGVSNYYATMNDLMHLFELCERGRVKTPEHLSVYLLSIEEGTPLYKNGVTVDDEKAAEEIKKIWKFLERQGYEHYEVSAFSRDNNRSMHNMRYWSLQNYIGLGSTASSHSKLGYDVSNSGTVDDYVNSPPFASYLEEKLTKADIASELILTHLRTTDGLKAEEFNALTGYSLDDIINAPNSDKNEQKTLKKHYNNGVFCLKSDELLFSDYYIRTLNNRIKE